MAAQRKFNTMPEMPNRQPGQEQNPSRVVKKHLKKSAKKKFYSIKMLLAISGVGVFGLMFMQLYLDSQINHINAQAEFMRVEINQALVRNEELASQVSELSRLTRIVEIATSHGLTLNDNVIRIER